MPESTRRTNINYKFILILNTVFVGLVIITQVVTRSLAWTDQGRDVASSETNGVINDGVATLSAAAAAAAACATDNDD